MEHSYKSAGFLAKIAPALRNQPINVAYLFGSHAHGTADFDSDIDIAILTNASLSKAERSALKLTMMRVVARALGVPLEKIDVVVLQDIPTLLQYNVIHRGTLLFARDPAIRREYELAVERRYEDERPYLERETEHTLHSILLHAQ